MAPYEREAILVLLDSLDRNAPATDRVALFAICAHLPAVNVCMAIGALGSRVTEYKTGVALAARYVFVKTAQWILRFVVIELRNIADRFPGSERVTVLAGHV